MPAVLGRSITKAVTSVVVLLGLFLLKAHSVTKSLHPLCPFVNISEPFFDYLEDISHILRVDGQNTTVPWSICVYNPAILHIKDDIYLWGARTYRARDSRNDCVPDPSVSRPHLVADHGRGTHAFLLSVTKMKMDADGKISHEVLGLRKYDLRLEDPRLFKDDKGELWLITHNFRGQDMTVERVHVNCTTTPGAAEDTPSNPVEGGSTSSGSSSVQRLRCGLSLGAINILMFFNSMQKEKNWVPHNGTTRMSYPIYHSFGPHKGFDWRSYSRPPMKTDFDFVAPQLPFFERLLSTFKGQVDLAGSTPAILYDDGVSYVAVGHIRAHPFCFHDPSKVTSVVSTCAGLASKPSIERRRWFWYDWSNGSYHHHTVEYAMFVYRFLAEAPYQITHISHAFVPCTYFDSGIVYPSGIERIGPAGKYIISYGEADRYSRIAVLSPAKMAQLLRPIEEMSEQVGSYTLCTLPCPAAAAGGGMMNTDSGGANPANPIVR